MQLKSLHHCRRHGQTLLEDCLVQLEKRIFKKDLIALKNSLKSADENDISNIIKKITSTEKTIKDIASKYKE